MVKERESFDRGEKKCALHCNKKEIVKTSKREKDGQGKSKSFNKRE
jgi:hypothetical protein